MVNDNIARALIQAEGDLELALSDGVVGTGLDVPGLAHYTLMDNNLKQKLKDAYRAAFAALLTSATEDWQPIGVGGAPAFQNSWANVGGSVEVAAYRREGDDSVLLRGTVRNGTVGQVIFTMPVNARPLKDVEFAVCSNGSIGCVRVSANGDVTPLAGSVTRFSLDGIRFHIA